MFTKSCIFLFLKIFYYNILLIIVYVKLLEHSSLPELRKENIYVENDLNTIHQQHMYEFIYDQQEIYDYYDEIFEERESSFPPGVINVRKPEKPFAYAVENFDDILAEFYDEKDMQYLANFRWYIVESNMENNDKYDNII